MISNICKVKNLLSQNSATMPYKFDTGSDGNVMLIHKFKILFPRVTKEQLVATGNKVIILKMNNTTVVQLDIGKEKSKHSKKPKNVSCL